MSEINLKDVEFESFLLDNVKLFDEVLSELGEPPLFENRNFTVHSAFKPFARALVMETTNKKENTLPVSIWFEADDLRIDIHGIPETYDRAKKPIDEDRKSVTDLIRRLFTGYVSVEIRGASHFVQIFDSKGFFVDAFSRNNWLHFFTGLYLFRYKNYRRIFFPMFSKTK